LSVPRKDKSSYYRALRGLVELGFVVRGEDGDMEINYDMAFVGNRMKVLKAAESMKRKTDRIVK
jgi:predicted transcriptional regulator